MSSVRRQDQGLGKTAAGGSGGSFAAHSRAAAAPPPAGAAQEHEHTAESVQNPKYSRQLIAERWGSSIRNLGDDGEGLHSYEVQRYLNNGEPHNHAMQVVLDERGDVRRVREHFPKAGPAGKWLDQDEHRDELQAAIRRKRLSDMGVIAEGVESDGGSYGRRFVGAKRDQLQGGHPDAAEIAKLARADVKRAQEWGALPPGKVTVRTVKGGGSQTVELEAEVPAGTMYAQEPRGMSDADSIDWQRAYRGKQSVGAKSVTSTLGAIGNQWNDYEHNPMHDYSAASYDVHTSVREQPQGIQQPTPEPQLPTHDEEEDRMMAAALRRAEF